MVRIKDIADMIGVSPTTVSNVIHGNTKKVSRDTILKVNEILDEVGYVPSLGARLLANAHSRIIGVVLGYEISHGKSAVQDPFVNTLLGTLERKITQQGYYLMIIGGDDVDKAADVASGWNIDGLIIVGFDEQQHVALKKQLNKPVIGIDTYTTRNDILTVGIDDFGGGYQLGQYIASLGYEQALFLSENDVHGDHHRWRGFQKAFMECFGHCEDSRHMIVAKEKELRVSQYQHYLKLFFRSGALCFASDYLAVEAINHFHDHHIRVPEQLSITGFDDVSFAEIVRPKLTTIHQDIEKKAAIAFEQLLKRIHNESVETPHIRIPVQLIKRNSVKTSL